MALLTAIIHINFEQLANRDEAYAILKESRINICADILNNIDPDPSLLDTVTLKGTRFESDGGSEPADRRGLSALLSTIEKSYGTV
ncbi:hypothetical protein NQ318_009923 [Aromia moschata]|uniref:Uncharacterized protein n=1 Tax=Aromia moschata TaxID=1265417 RepID=A0AAV8YBM6_9CUCU|nr:hypothetical protein NQ318_009923 [Aromia moschata]